MQPSERFVEMCKGAWLQEKWEPKLGDWYWSDKVECAMLIPDSRQADGIQRQWRFWLPSLTRILDMLEAAGIDWTLISAKVVPTGKYAAVYFSKVLAMKADTPEEAALLLLGHVHGQEWDGKEWRTR